MRNKIILTVILTLMTTSSLASNVKITIDPQLQNDFRKNSSTVTSVSEVLADKKKEKSIDINSKYNELLNTHCSSEARIFCNTSISNTLSCLKENSDLITGKCKKLLSANIQKISNQNSLIFHDLNLPRDSKYFGSKNMSNHKKSQYKTDSVFDYRGVRFRRGVVTVRSYSSKEYKGEYIVSSALPKTIFKDNSNIEYNPYWQKGPFFFDEKGNVSIGTLSKDLEYKKYIYLKKGTLVVFNKERELLKGIVAKSVRVGSCGFLPNMEISEEKIKECQE